MNTSPFPIALLPQEIFEEVILYAAVDRGVKFSPQLLRNLRLVNKDFNRAGTRLLFRYFNATIGRGVSPTMPLYDLSKIVKAGHGHRIRKLIIGNLCPICTSSDEDVVDYVEGFGYYFPDIFQQLVGLQSLDIGLAKAFTALSTDTDHCDAYFYCAPRWHMVRNLRGA
ncbi:predicted protein [Aspergillus terreus NIH2624]|uniref:F-box domain-containing protein n=1 Tax=Aspergillus terreus (strain NIH 2624 / FGSC A1156) TaxID=341663 RepID=Q0CUI2_ASPTN|nr:uncharacterized protein ATEG_02652 [Aspergillus terreus NIH2624]EAU37614.1 predicted protein [Aspergillus terreus NIH2624]